jgi:hypothetical protein
MIVGYVLQINCLSSWYSLIAENRFYPSRSIANRAILAKNPLGSVQRSIRAKLHWERSFRQKLQESILRRSRRIISTGMHRHWLRENLNLGDGLGEMASYLWQVSCSVYHSGRTNK